MPPNCLSLQEKPKCPEMMAQVLEILVGKEKGAKSIKYTGRLEVIL